MEQIEMSMDQQADVLANEPNVVFVGQDKRRVEVYKCKVKQIGPVLRLVAKLMKDLGVLDIDNEKELMQLESKTSDPAFLLQLIATYSEELPMVVSLLTSLDEVEVEELDLEDALNLTMKVWEVNQAFFSQRILPMVGRGSPVAETEN